MSKTPWTPGPWVVAGADALDVMGSDTQLVAIAAGENYGVWRDAGDDKDADFINRANARLIAAAPEMAEVLMGTTVSLIAAISLLERGGKKAASSDRMFAHMLSDYQKSVDEARALLARIRGNT